MNPTPAPEPRTKRPNSFQLLGGILAAAVGIRGNSARSSGFADASTATILGAVLIFCTVVGLCGYAFVKAVENAVAN